MLRLSNEFLVEGGHLFVAVRAVPTLCSRSKSDISQLPLPCLSNSRYLDFSVFGNLMTFLGFIELQRHWKKGGKMVYYLFQKQTDVDLPSRKRLVVPEQFTKKTILRQGNRNNFSILL